MPRTDGGVRRPVWRLQQTFRQEIPEWWLGVRFWIFFKLGPSNFSGGLDMGFEKMRNQGYHQGVWSEQLESGVFLMKVGEAMGRTHL